MTKSYSPDHYKDLLHLHTTVHSQLRIGFGGNSVSAMRPRTPPIYARSEQQGATVQHHLYVAVRLRTRLLLCSLTLSTPEHQY